MEKLLTTEPEEFSRFLVDSSDPAPSEADNRQAYHYTMVSLALFRAFAALADDLLARSRIIWFCDHSSTPTTSTSPTALSTSRRAGAWRFVRIA